MRRFLPLMLAVALATSAVWAEDRVESTAESVALPDSSLFAEGLLAGTYRRNGALLDLWLRYRHRLYDSNDDAFRDNYWGVGLSDQVSPVFNQVGLYAEVAPSSFFRISGAYQLVGYFGVLGSLRPLSDCEGAAKLSSEDARCRFAPLEPGEQVEQHAELGHRAWVEALAQARVGRFVAYDTFTAERWWFRGGWRAGSAYGYWFNELFALPQTRDDSVLTNSGAVLFELVPDRGGSHPNVLIGVGDDLYYSIGTGYLTQRLGALAVYRVPEWHSARELAVALVVQLYTHDRYLAGALPFVGLVLSAATPSFLSKGQP